MTSRCYRSRLLRAGAETTTKVLVPFVVVGVGLMLL